MSSSSANNNVIASGNTNTDSQNTHSYNTDSYNNNSYNNNFNFENASGSFTVNTGLQGQQLRSLERPLNEVENSVREISESLEDKKRSKILKWLSKVNYIEHHEFICSTRQANTGNWLFEKPDFIQWEKESSSSIFWLHGNPGAGKTVLASSVIDMARHKNHALTYFYCKYGETDRQEPQSVFSTILKQLSLLSPKGFLPKAVISLYEEQKMNGVDSGRLSLEKSAELIRQLSGAFAQTTIIVDALDECHKETRHQLMAALKKLCSSTDGLKIFLTSRNDDDIRVQLEDESEVYIQPSDNSSDIGRFIVAEVEEYISTKRLLRGKVGPELKQTVIDTLTKGARGMFLWVRLQLEHMCKEKSEDSIQLALQRLPKDLEATYLIIWDKIQADTDENRSLAERTLKWIICAKRPLTMLEIIEATSVMPMQWAERPDHGNITLETFLDVCQNLVVLDKELGVLRTAHFSVTEFLLKTISSSEAHTTAAEACLTLLCSENHVRKSRETENHVLENYTLCDYMMRYWAEHLRLSGNGTGAATDLQKMFFQPSSAYSKWLRVSNSRYAFGNGQVVSDDGEWSDLLSENEKGELNPLWVACYFQLWDIFKYLLESNPDCTMKNRWGGMPINLVTQYGYCAGVKLLLEQKGVRLNVKTDDGNTPLHLAASHGQEDMVRLLLSMNPNSKIGSGRTEGDSVTRDRAMAIFRRLLIEQNGVHLNAKSNNGYTPLHSAASQGHESVVRLLLEQKGALVNAKDQWGDTPLHDAAEQGHEAVVRLLLKQKGVDFNAKNKGGVTPRDSAAKRGKTEVVRLLDEAMAAREGNTSGRGWLW